jgi:ABC-2 type transport system permease protein
MRSQIAAILRAQLRTMLNFRRGEGSAGRIFSVAVLLFWYGLWAVVAVASTLYASDPAQAQVVRSLLPWAFLMIFVYWQVVPVMTASMGATLETRKLLVYPIPESGLFRIEVLLRLTAGFEMLLVLCGLTLGVAFNPAIRGSGALLTLPLFTIFNLLVASGLRVVIDRLMRLKRLREAAILLLVLSAALPQLLVTAGLPAPVRRSMLYVEKSFFPWSAAADLSLGQHLALAGPLLAAWIGLAWWFGRRQFAKSLQSDESVARAIAIPKERGSFLDRIYRLPGALLPDPLAALVEKDLRSLARTPRFRLLFLMGFSFGFLIWFPMLHRHSNSPAAQNIPVFVSVYSLLLLAEVLFWNVFGFDRSAAQAYFAFPVPFSKALAGKNVAATFFVVAEVSIIMLVCAIFRLPLGAAKVAESYAVVLVICVYLFGIGNLSSVYYPRPINPEQTWGRASAGKVGLMMLFVLPAVAFPVTLAYLARWALDSQPAFYAALAIVAGAGAIFYHVSTGSAIEAAARRREEWVSALSQTGGPVGSE